jgi:hypothetical protein
MPKAFPAAALLTLGALAWSAAPARAQININIGTPAPQYVVVHEVHPVKKPKGPKYKKGTVLLVPAGPVYYAPRGRGRGHGKH